MLSNVVYNLKDVLLAVKIDTFVCHFNHTQYCHR